MSHHSEFVYGIHTCEAIYNKFPQRIEEVFVLDSAESKPLLALLEALSAKQTLSVHRLNREQLDDKAQSRQHQGIVMKCQAAQLYDKQYLQHLVNQASRELFFLILDGVTDPHNLGACIRSAEAAGIDAIIIPKNRAAGLSPVTRKVACGAAEIIPIVSVSNLAQIIKYFKKNNIWIYGAAGEAEQSIYQTDLTGHIALVMGSEGDGLRHLTRESCDTLFHIPMYGYTNSLNVSVATGVCLFEALRQRAKSA